MKLIAISTFFVSALALPLADVADKKLPTCDNTPRACTCPDGTTYTNSTTWATYPASIKDVEAITGNYFKTAWFGSAPAKTSGKTNTAGSSRTMMGRFPNAGIHPAEEKLTKYTKLPNNGGFKIEYEMGNGPIRYNTTDGKQEEAAGYWERMDVTKSGKDKTYFYWNIYACFTTPFDYQDFHESAMKNVSSILTKKGQMHGKLDGPHTKK